MTYQDISFVRCDVDSVTYDCTLERWDGGEKGVARRRVSDIEIAGAANQSLQEFTTFDDESDFTLVLNEAECEVLDEGDGKKFLTCER